MSYAGHVADMISRIKYNESIRRSRRVKYGELRESYLDKLWHYNSEEGGDKKLSQNEMNAIKAQIRKEIKTQRRRQVVFSVIVSAAILGFLAWLMLWIVNGVVEKYQ